MLKARVQTIFKTFKFKQNANTETESCQHKRKVEPDGDEKYNGR